MAPLLDDLDPADVHEVSVAGVGLADDGAEAFRQRGVQVLLEHAARGDLRRGVAVAQDDVVHAVRGRSVVLDRPAVRAAVERRRAGIGAARAGRCRVLPPRPAVPVVPPRPAAPPAAPRAAAPGGAVVPPRRRVPPRPRLPAVPAGARAARRPAAPAAPVVPPGPTLPALPVLPAVPVVPAARGARPAASCRRWRSSPRSRSCPRRLARCCRRFRTAWDRLRGRQAPARRPARSARDAE